LLPGTVFLYGQTGSGKTYTHEAVTQEAAATIFGAEESGRELAAVTVSCVEIYCENIRCLLTGHDVALRQAQRSGNLVLEGAGEEVGKWGSLGGCLQGTSICRRVLGAASSESSCLNPLHPTA
jgi:hypothetical protein